MFYLAARFRGGVIRLEGITSRMALQFHEARLQKDDRSGEHAQGPSRLRAAYDPPTPQLRGRIIDASGDQEARGAISTPRASLP